ncbi:NAD-dependent DNA ligase LigA [Myxococcota bacterium]|nr:NAD-dependent DNA ligase LigA [Myxococcota bacterium]
MPAAHVDPIEELALQLRHHRDAYYNGTPEISDAEFDALEDRLRALAPDHPVLAEVGAPPPAPETTPELEAQLDAALSRSEADKLAAELDRLAERFYAKAVDVDDADAMRRYKSDARAYFTAWEKIFRHFPDHPILGRVPPAEGRDWPKARHELPMGSLNKVNAADELRDWAKRCDELATDAKLDPISADLSVTEKLDGLSLEVLYQDGRLDSAITRGDGVIGELVTANVRWMKGVPAEIPAKGRVSVRGEIVLKKSDAGDVERFKKRVDQRFEELKSLRNTAAGLARAKEPKYLFGCTFLSVLFYDLEGYEGLRSEREKLETIASWGFDTPSVHFGPVEEIITYFDDYEKKRRAELDWEIDGLVVRANQLHASTMLGELNNRPRAAVAFKFSSEMQVTTLLGVLWSTGDSGRITPIAQIEPVRLAGAEVKQASLHNLANVKRLGIGVGDQVLVSRRNDVIPYVEKLVVKGEKVEEAPATCARCDTPVTVEGEYLVCRNALCPARRVGRLKVWIREVGLLDWGEKTLERFVDEGLVSEPAELYALTVEKITKLSGFGTTSAEKLLGPLREKMRLPLAVFVAALGIETVSRETAKLLVGAGYDTIEKIAAATPEELANIPGLGEIKAQRITDGVRGRLAEIERLKAAGVVPVALAEGGPLAGLSFCFSGSSTRPRKVLEQLVEKNGGSVASSVTKGLKYLVLADPSSTSSKAEKARKLGTEVIDEARFDQIITERGGSLQ